MLPTGNQTRSRHKFGETIFLGKGHRLGHEAKLGTRLSNEVLVILGEGEHLGPLVCSNPYPARLTVQTITTGLLCNCYRGGKRTHRKTCEKRSEHRSPFC